MDIKIRVYHSRLETIIGEHKFQYADIVVDWALPTLPQKGEKFTLVNKMLDKKLPSMIQFLVTNSRYTVHSIEYEAIHNTIQFIPKITLTCDY